MAREVDFYAPDRVARALRLSELTIFRMSASAQLEGHQDEWGQGRIPASAVARALGRTQQQPADSITQTVTSNSEVNQAAAAIATTPQWVLTPHGWVLM
jgi:hypothetical protein